MGSAPLKLLLPTCIFWLLPPSPSSEWLLLMPSPGTGTTVAATATVTATALAMATDTAMVIMATTARDLLTRSPLPPLLPSLGTGTTVAATAMDTATAMAMATDTATATTDKQQTKDYVGIVGRVQFE